MGTRTETRAAPLRTQGQGEAEHPCDIGNPKSQEQKRSATEHRVSGARPPVEDAPSREHRVTITAGFMCSDKQP